METINGKVIITHFKQIMHSMLRQQQVTPCLSSVPLSWFGPSSKFILSLNPYKSLLNLVENACIKYDIAGI